MSAVRTRAPLINREHAKLLAALAAVLPYAESRAEDIDDGGKAARAVERAAKLFKRITGRDHWVKS